MPSIHPSQQPSSQPTQHPSQQPYIHPTAHPSGSEQQQQLQVPTLSPDTATYVGILSYQDPYKCKRLQSFNIYPTSTCLVVANSHPDESAFISGRKQYSCGLNSASVLTYSATDTTCSGQPYDVYPLPNYGKCPAEAELPTYSCLNASTVASLSKSVRAFLTEDGVPMYHCVTTSKKSSYTYVCHGPHGIEKLVYSRRNCKGKATVVRRSFFEAMGDYCSSTTLTTLPTCMGPSTL
eukprot:gene26252-34876_t